MRVSLFPIFTRRADIPVRSRPRHTGIAAPSHVGIMHMVIFQAACLLVLRCFAANPGAPPDYSAVDEIFSRHCLDCHATQDPEHGLVLEGYKDLLKGGETGPAIIAGKSDDSLLARWAKAALKKTGK